MDDIQVVRKSQSKFCLDLMKRLDKDINKTKIGYGCYVYGRSRIQNDIVRLRRELLELSKMFDYAYKEGE